MRKDKSYQVCVLDPPAMYARDYFPRSFHYKKEAIACAKLVVSQGASMARVECPNGGEIDFRPERKKG